MDSRRCTDIGCSGTVRAFLGYDFTGYDDDEYVTESPYVQRGLSVGIYLGFTTGHAAVALNMD